MLVGKGMVQVGALKVFQNVDDVLMQFHEVI